MKFILYISDFIMPFVIFYVVGFGLLMKRNVYDDFINGAKQGIKTVFDIMPTLIGLMLGVGIMRCSGVLEWMCARLDIIARLLHFPSQLMPMVIVRMFSSSAATGLALDIFKEYGTDSYMGMLASVLMSCTETIFYTMSVYFMTAKVKKSRWTLAGALVATFAGIVASVVIVGGL